MTSPAKLTPAQRKALQWIKAHEPVSMFPCDGTAPSMHFVKKLRQNGLVTDFGKEASKWGFTLFAVSDLGRKLLDGTAKGDAA